MSETSPPTYHIEYDDDRFSFEAAFQIRILAALFQDRRFLRSFRSAVDHRFFEDFVHRDVAELILKHFDRYAVPPDDVELAEAVGAAFNTDPAWKAKSPDAYISLLASLPSVPLGAPQHVADQVVRFARHQAMKTAILQGADCLPSEDYEEVERLIRWALSVGDDLSKRGLIYSQSFERMIDTPFETIRGPTPTGIVVLDKVLAGGLGKSELGIVAGAQGSGKTLMLVEFAAGALMAGRNVLYASVEDNEQKLVERLNRRLAKRTRKDITSDKDKVKDRIRQLLKLRRGEVLFRWWAPYAAKVSDVDAHRDWAEQELGKRIDVVVFDYLDKFRPPRKRGRGDEEIGDLYDEAMGFAGRLDIPVWSGSQLNTDGMKISKTRDGVADMHHLSGARAKANPAHVILTLNQTDHERNVKPISDMRVYIAKNRDNAGGRRIIPVKIDYARSRVSSKDAVEDTETSQVS